MSDVHALSGAYALDAVTDQERASFERHMATCEPCQVEVASLRETAAVLSDLSVEDPPPALRASVLSSIKDVRQLPPHPRHHRRRFHPRMLLVAAAAVVAIAGGVGVAVTEPWKDDQSQTLTAADRVLNDPDAQRVTQTFDDGAEATVVRSPAEGRAVIVTHDMPNAPEGHSYVIWLQQGDRMVKAATMPQGPDNTVLLDGDAGTASAAGVTVEPDPDASEPTGDPIAIFPF